MKLILTGATGMVGEGVLTECLLHPLVEAVLIVNRKPSGVLHPKLKEIVHQDFFNLTSIESQLAGYDGCLFCLGVTSIGKKEPEYTKLTYDLTMNFAKTVSKLNSGMVFCYISGAGTDSSEKGRLMWARVKGKTENDLRNLPFKASYAFRPAFLVPTTGAKNVLPAYKYVNWLVPVMKTFFPNSIVTLKDLGQAMIQAVDKGYEKSVLDVKDIKASSKLQAPSSKGK